MTQPTILERTLAWLLNLTDDRQKNVWDKFETLRVKRLEISLLECADFCDKRRVVRKLCGWSYTFEDQLGDIETLRNSVAHAGDYLDIQNGLAKMLKTVQMTEHWIKQVASQISPHT